MPEFILCLVGHRLQVFACLVGKRALARLAPLEHFTVPFCSARHFFSISQQQVADKGVDA